MHKSKRGIVAAFGLATLILIAVAAVPVLKARNTGKQPAQLWELEVPTSLMVDGWLSPDGSLILTDDTEGFVISADGVVTLKFKVPAAPTQIHFAPNGLMLCETHADLVFLLDSEYQLAWELKITGAFGSVPANTYICGGTRAGFLPSGQMYAASSYGDLAVISEDGRIVSGFCLGRSLYHGYHLEPFAGNLLAYDRGQGRLICLTLEGEELWSNPLGLRDVDSCRIIGDTVVVVDVHGFLIMLDEAGQEQWRKNLKLEVTGQQGVSSRIRLVETNDARILGYSNQQLFMYDLLGELQWKAEAGHPITRARCGGSQTDCLTVASQTKLKGWLFNLGFAQPSSLDYFPLIERFSEQGKHEGEWNLPEDSRLAAGPGAAGEYYFLQFLYPANGIAASSSDPTLVHCFHFE